MDDFMNIIDAGLEQAEDLPLVCGPVEMTYDRTLQCYLLWQDDRLIDVALGAQVAGVRLREWQTRHRTRPAVPSHVEATRKELASCAATHV